MFVQSQGFALNFGHIKNQECENIQMGGTAK